MDTGSDHEQTNGNNIKRLHALHQPNDIIRYSSTISVFNLFVSKSWDS